MNPSAKAAESQGNTLKWYQEVPQAGWRALTAAGLGWMFETFDAYVFAFTIPAFAYYFQMTNAEAGLIGSIAAIGMTIGGIINGWFSDRAGRVKGLVVAIFIYSVFTGLTALATSVLAIGILRFIAGLGLGGEWAAGATLVAETWPAKLRGRGGALMQTGLAFGAMLAIGAAAVITNIYGSMNDGAWRWMYIIGGLPIFLLIYVVRYTPESEIWKKKKLEAQLMKKTNPRAGTTDLFQKGNLKRLLMAFGFIFFLQYIWWAVFTWTPAFLVSTKNMVFLRSLSFTLIQQVGCLAGFLVMAAFVDKFGRKPMFISYLIIGGLSVVLLTYSIDQHLLMLACFATGFGITGIFGGLGPWVSEMLPNTDSRGLALGLAYNGGRIGGFIAPYVVGVFATSAGGFQMGMMTSVLAFVLAFLVIIASPETKGEVIS